MNRQDRLRAVYGLQKHVEGGDFSEVYTAPFEKDGRPMAGSIYFLLDAGEISHFHAIDCDEIWYYHEGCGMRITVLTEGRRETLLLGKDVEKGERAMAVIPKGGVFAAENLESDGYTFVSCATTPQFRYSGFKLLDSRAIRELCPEDCEDILYLAAETCGPIRI